MTDIKEILLSDILKIEDVIYRHRLITLHYPVLNPEYLKMDLLVIKELHNAEIKLPRIIIDLAIKTNNLNILKYLIEEIKIPADYKDLNTAIENNQIEIVKYLLSITNLEGSNLRLAISKNKLEIIKLFFDYKIICRNNILDFVAKSGNLEMFKFFIDKGFKITNETLNIACNNNQRDILDYLLGKKQVSQSDLINLLIRYKDKKEISEYLVSYMK